MTQYVEAEIFLNSYIFFLYGLQEIKTNLTKTSIIESFIVNKEHTRICEVSRF